MTGDLAGDVGDCEPAPTGDDAEWAGVDCRVAAADFECCKHSCCPEASN